MNDLRAAVPLLKNKMSQGLLPEDFFCEVLS
jgi:hypothetical protein